MNEPKGHKLDVCIRTVIMWKLLENQGSGRIIPSSGQEWAGLRLWRLGYILHTNMFVCWET